MEAVQTPLSDDRVMCPVLLPKLHCKPYRYLCFCLFVSVDWCGEHGAILGVGMIVKQLDVARSYQQYHSHDYCYAKSNVEFHVGYIESLADLPLDLASFDVIVSNCVVNLAIDKEVVLRGAFNLLKLIGKIYF